MIPVVTGAEDLDFATRLECENVDDDDDDDYDDLKLQLGLDPEGWPSPPSRTVSRDPSQVEVEVEVENDAKYLAVCRTPSSLSSLANEIVISLASLRPSATIKFSKQPVIKQRERSHDLTEDLQIVDASLLRATSSRSLLRNFGTIFREAAGNERSFRMSRPVEVIDKFLSHSWCTPGWLKTLMLMYQSNLEKAVVAAFLTAVLIHTYEYFRGSALNCPCMEWSYVPGSAGITKFWLDIHFLPPCLVFLAILFFGHELPAFRSEMFFLDKCCIHQSDVELKRLGIQQLGRFIRVSRTLVILWQPEYLTRLWCVYELAAFHYINRDIAGTIELLPLKLPVLWLGLFLFHLVACIGFTFIGPLTVLSKWHADWTMATIPSEFILPYLCCLFWAVLYFLYCIPGFLLWRFCREYVLDRQLLLLQLANFRMGQTDCTKECDRRFVEGKITRWFGSVEDFENVVRIDIFERVKQGMKEQGLLPWRMILISSLSHFFAAAALAVEAHHRKDYETMVRCICLGACLVLCTDAIAIRIGLCLASKAAGQALTWRSTLLNSSLITCAFTFGNGIALCLASSSLSVTLDVVIVILAAVITWLLYGGWDKIRCLVRHYRGLQPESEGEGSHDIDISAEVESATLPSREDLALNGCAECTSLPPLPPRPAPTVEDDGIVHPTKTSSLSASRSTVASKSDLRLEVDMCPATNTIVSLDDAVCSVV